jgi:hypothetical protein
VHAPATPCPCVSRGSPLPPQDRWRSDHSVSHPVATPRVHPLKAPVFLCEMDLARVFRRTPRRGVADLDLGGADRGLGQRGAFRAWRQAATSVGTRCFPARASHTSRSGWAAGINERLRTAERGRRMNSTKQVGPRCANSRARGTERYELPARLVCRDFHEQSFRRVVFDVHAASTLLCAFVNA